MPKNRFIKKIFEDIDTVPAALGQVHFPSLDGLRGIAILMVVFSHLKYSHLYLYDAVFNGKLGVIIFFVLSGFLITTLCIKEKVITSDISLKKFYLRRLLRIFPVAYLFILVIVILNLIFHLQVDYINIIGAVFYLMNFSSFFRKYHSSVYTGHFWSLAVEEQFYLIVPFILKKDFKLYLLLILFIVFLLPFAIALQYRFPVLDNFILTAFTHYLIKFQAIGVGCLFSVFVFKFPLNNKLAKSKVFTNLLAIFLIGYIQYDNLFTVKDIFSGLIISFLIGFIIISNIVPAKDFIFKILNSKILSVTGILSYSIYIWQQLFTSKDYRLPNFMVASPYNVICLIIVSCLSYYFYESFFLRLKSKFSLTQKITPELKAEPVA